MKRASKGVALPIETSAVVAAALGRLNQEALIQVVQQIASEFDRQKSALEARLEAGLAAQRDHFQAQVDELKATVKKLEMESTLRKPKPRSRKKKTAKRRADK